MTVDLRELGPIVNSDFGFAATFEPARGDARQIHGVFDEAYREIILSPDSPPATDVSPVIGVNMADFADDAPPLQGDRITITEAGYPFTGNTYQIRDVRPDSHGWAILFLNGPL